MMKSLILKSALFFLLLILIKVPFYKDVLDYRNAAFSKQQFTAVFIGSSRTDYGVIPAYFDFLTHHKTKSYNFGISEGLPPETFDWCDELIRNNPSLRYVFFELSGGFVAKPRPGARLSWASYLHTWKNLPFDKISAYHDNLVAGFFKPNLWVKQPDYNVPFENALDNKDLRAKTPTAPEILQRSYRFNQSVETGGFAVPPPINEEYWQRVRRLIELTEAKQIRLYFFIPPRLETEREARTVYPIYQKLEKKYKLSVAHDEAALYQDDTSVDDFHLNHKGAMRFTENMAAASNQQE